MEEDQYEDAYTREIDRLRRKDAEKAARKDFRQMKRNKRRIEKEAAHPKPSKNSKGREFSLEYALGLSVGTVIIIVLFRLVFGTFS